MFKQVNLIQNKIILYYLQVDIISIFVYIFKIILQTSI